MLVLTCRRAPAATGAALRHAVARRPAPSRLRSGCRPLHRQCPGGGGTRHARDAGGERFFSVHSGGAPGKDAEEPPRFKMHPSPLGTGGGGGPAASSAEPCMAVQTEQKNPDSPPPVEQPTALALRLHDASLAAAGCFAGIGALAAMHYGVLDGSPYTLVLGSMGATAVLVFGAPAAPFSQPWNVIAGHLFAAASGIAASQFIAMPMGTPVLALPVAAAAAVFAMKLGDCVHPPAGGTALIAVLGSAQIHALGWGLLAPVAFGSVVLVVVGGANNLVGRKYPA